LITAPWVTDESFADALNARKLPGVYFRPAVVEPTFHKHARKTCGGCQVHVTERTAFRPVETGVHLIEAFQNAARDQFAWNNPPYEYEHEKIPIDVLYGSSTLRESLDARVPARDVVRTWDRDVEPFITLRSRFLLY
jgi:uncharacterized protein YbbC (DUF1343 family)